MSSIFAGCDTKALNNAVKEWGPCAPDPCFSNLLSYGKHRLHPNVFSWPVIISMRIIVSV